MSGKSNSRGLGRVDRRRRMYVGEVIMRRSTGWAREMKNTLNRNHSGWLFIFERRIAQR